MIMNYSVRRFAMGDIIMKKITKRNYYQVISIFVFLISIAAVLNNKVFFGYTFIILGYYLLRKSDL